MANNNSSSSPQILVVIDPQSFSSYSKIESVMKKLQSDLNRLLQSNPLTVQVKGVVDETFKTNLSIIKTTIQEIRNSQNVILNINTEQALREVYVIEGKLRELKSLGVFDIRVNSGDIAKSVEHMVTQMNQQFAKLGGVELLSGLNEAIEKVAQMPSKLKQSMAASANTTKNATQGIREGAAAASTEIGTLTRKVNTFSTSLGQYANVDSFKELERGALNVQALVEKISTKLKNEKLSLVGQLDINATVAAIKGQLAGNGEIIARTLNAEGVGVDLVGGLSTMSTVSQISKDIATNIEPALRGNASVSIPARITATTDKNIDSKLSNRIAQIDQQVDQISQSLSKLGTIDLSPYVSRWNADIAKFSVDSITTKVEAARTAFASLGSLFTTSVMTASGQNSDRTSRKQRSRYQTTTSSMATATTSAVPISVTVAATQISSAVNVAIQQVNASSLRKVPLKVEVVNVVAAVDEAITKISGAQSKLKKVPILIDTSSIDKQLIEKIKSLNKAGELPPVRLRFDTSLFEAAIEKVKILLLQLQNTMKQSVGTSIPQSPLGQVDSYLRTMHSSMSGVQKLMSQFNKSGLKNASFLGSDGKTTVKYTDELGNALEAVKTQYKEVSALFRKGDINGALQHIQTSKIDLLIAALREAEIRARNFYDTLGGRSLPSSKYLEDYGLKLLKYQQQLKTFKIQQSTATDAGLDATQLDRYSRYLNVLQKRYNRLKLAMNRPLMTSDDVNHVIKLAQEVDFLNNRVIKYLELLKATRTGYVMDAKELDKVTRAQEQLNKYVEKYGARLKRYPELWKEIQALQKKMAAGGDSFALQKEMNLLIRRARALGVETENIFTKVWERVGFNFRSMVASYGYIYLFSTFRSLYNNVKNLDTAMTELKKVTDGTAATYEKFLDDASKRAKKLGATLVDVVSATSDFARLGYSISESSTLSDAALTYLNVGDDVDSIEDSTKALISTMQGFGIEASNVMHIVDEFNEVSNTYASSAGDIGEITQRSAAAMAAAGSTLEETIALGVTANTVQQDAATVGTAMKTMSMRLRSTKTEMEAAGEDTDGMAESVSKLRDEILALSGVDIMLDDETYKTPYQMLLEIGKVWDDLNDITRANITELLFGKRQANIGTAILQNIELAESILDTANNSAGSAQRENEVYLESITGHLAELTATWQVLSKNLLDTGAVKGFLDVINSILSGLNSIVDLVGSLPVLLGAVTAAMVPLRSTDKIMSPYREKKQALGCWCSSKHRGETSKSWEQLKLAS